MKNSVWIIVAAAAAIGLLVVYSKNKTATQQAQVYTRIAPGNTLNNNIAGVLSAVGPDFEELIGVTPQGSQSAYSGPYTPGGTVPIDGNNVSLYNLPFSTTDTGALSTLNIGTIPGGGLDTLQPYSDTIFGDGSDEL